MPVYVYSGAGGSNNGTSWTDAYTSIASTTGVAAGTEILVASDHAESNTAGLTLAWSNGTFASPIKIISVNSSDDSYLAGASVTRGDAGNFADIVLNGNILCFGVSWTAGRIQLATTETAQVRQDFYDCEFALNQANAGYDRLLMGNNSARLTIRLVNCTYDSSTATSWDSIVVQGLGIYVFSGLTLSLPGTVSNAMFNGPANAVATSQALIENSDLSGIQNLVNTANGGHQYTFRRCKLHASWSSTTGTKNNAVQRVLVESCDDGTITVPALGLSSFDTFYGKVTTTLSKYRTGGASDGLQANAYSWEMVTNSNALEIYNALESPPLVRFVDPDASISGATAKGIATSTKCTLFATPTALTTDGDSTWNGTGVGTKQKISVTLTNGDTLTVFVASGGTLNDDDFWIEVFEPDQVGGPVSVKCYLAKPSTTVYVDPLPVIS